MMSAFGHEAVMSKRHIARERMLACRRPGGLPGQFLVLHTMAEQGRTDRHDTDIFHAINKLCSEAAMKKTKALLMIR